VAILVGVQCICRPNCENAVHPLELYLFLLFINIITSMFLYYACKGPLVKLQVALNK